MDIRFIEQTWKNWEVPGGTPPSSPSSSPFSCLFLFFVCVIYNGSVVWDFSSFHPWNLYGSLLWCNGSRSPTNSVQQCTTCAIDRVYLFPYKILNKSNSYSNEDLVSVTTICACGFPGQDCERFKACAYLYAMSDANVLKTYSLIPWASLPPVTPPSCIERKAIGNESLFVSNNVEPGNCWLCYTTWRESTDGGTFLFVEWIIIRFCVYRSLLELGEMEILRVETGGVTKSTGHNSIKLISLNIDVINSYIPSSVWEYIASSFGDMILNTTRGRGWIDFSSAGHSALTSRTPSHSYLVVM